MRKNVKREGVGGVIRILPSSKKMKELALNKNKNMLQKVLCGEKIAKYTNMSEHFAVM